MGQFKRAKREGKGQLLDENGRVYFEGRFKRGKLDGEGTWFGPEGKVVVKIFNQGKLVENSSDSAECEKSPERESVIIGHNSSITQSSSSDMFMEFNECDISLGI